MPPRVRFAFSVFSLVCFAIAAASLVSELRRRSDIWWTPRPLMVPLAQSADRVELYVRSEPLAALIESGRLRVEKGGTWSALSAGEVGLRFNNWDRVRAQRLPLLLGYGAMCGFSAAIFLIIATGRLAYREERGAPAA